MRHILSKWHGESLEDDDGEALGFIDGLAVGADEGSALGKLLGCDVLHGLQETVQVSLTPSTEHLSAMFVVLISEHLNHLLLSTLIPSAYCVPKLDSDFPKSAQDPQVTGQ